MKTEKPGLLATIGIVLILIMFAAVAFKAVRWAIS